MVLTSVLSCSYSPPSSNMFPPQNRTLLCRVRRGWQDCHSPYHTYIITVAPTPTPTKRNQFSSSPAPLLPIILNAHCHRNRHSILQPNSRHLAKTTGKSSSQALGFVSFCFLLSWAGPYHRCDAAVHEAKHRQALLGLSNAHG